MSKHFSIFQTETQYQTAKETLDYPNVSLIDTTGDLHYSISYTGQEVVNAPFGSILMADAATNKLFYIDNSDYNLTDYPLESYKPIAVCIYDKDSNANEQTVFLAVQWADYSSLGTPKASSKMTSWGFDGVDMSAKVTGIRDKGTNHVSSITINNSMKSLVIEDYSGSSINNKTGDGYSCAFCSSWRFKTLGTNEGDWYLPSYYDLMKFLENYSSIVSVFTNIKTVAGSSYLNSTNDGIWTSIEDTKNRCFVLNSSGQFNASISTTKNTVSNWSVRPVFIPQVQEL